VYRHDFLPIPTGSAVCIWCNILVFHFVSSTMVLYHMKKVKGTVQGDERGTLLYICILKALFKSNHRRGKKSFFITGPVHNLLLKISLLCQVCTYFLRSIFYLKLQYFSVHLWSYNFEQTPYFSTLPNFCQTKQFQFKGTQELADFLHIPLFEIPMPKIWKVLK